jgi:predicted regulator of Ras-like GTPase activity (Roadblock/LC7/MglB family)
MTQSQNSAEQLGWLLDNLVSRVANVTQALVLSRDGLVVAKSRTVSKEEGDQLSALAAGVHSLARGTGQQVGGGEVRQTIIEMESAFMFVMAAGRGTCLAVLASSGASLGVMAYEMTMLVRRMGAHLTAAPRSAQQHPTVR